MEKRQLTPDENRVKGITFLIYFRVEKILPLVGDRETGIILK
jgi:hypothetical protein